MVSDFHYDSLRAKKARLGVQMGRFDHWWWAPFLLLVAGAGALLAIELPLGWFIASLAVVPYGLHRWYQGEIAHLPISGSTADGLLTGDVLGRLPATPTPRDIAWALRSVNDGLFMALRLGLSPALIQNLVSDDPSIMPEFWQFADRIRQYNQLEQITGSVLMVALVRSVPGYQNILAELQLDDEDLDGAVQWQHHLRQLVAQIHQPRRTGGVARDWSFGYIPLLRRFGQNISEQISRGGGMFSVDVASHTKAIDQLIDIFGTRGRQNAVLVGQAGTGKTPSFTPLPSGYSMPRHVCLVASSFGRCLSSTHHHSSLQHQAEVSSRTLLCASLVRRILPRILSFAWIMLSCSSKKGLARWILPMYCCLFSRQGA